MIYSKFIKCLILLVLSFSFFACSENVQVEENGDSSSNAVEMMKSVKDLEGRDVACLSGAVFPLLTDPFVDDVHYKFFEDNISMVQALLSDKIDAVLFDEPIATLYQAMYSEKLYIASIFVEDSYGFVLKKDSPLTLEINKVIADLDALGVLKSIKEKWISIKPEQEELEVWTHKKDYTGEKGTLVFGVDPTQMPMTYMGKNHLAVGIDVEVMNRVAYELDMKLKIVTMNFASLIPAVSGGKIDVAGGAISITQERKKLVDMTDTHYKGGISILAKYPDNYKPALSTVDKELNLAKTGRAGVMTGSYGELVVDIKLQNKNIFSFDSFSDGIPALKSKKIDYIIGSYTSLVAFTKTNDDLIILPTFITEDGNAIAFRKDSPNLKDKIDEIITKFEKDGTLADLEQRWIKDFNFEMPVIKSGENASVLKVGVAANREPVCFIQDLDFVGYDCELIERIAKELNMKVEYVDMKFSSLIPALQSGKVDLIISNITKTKERAEVVDFSKIYFKNPQALIVHKDTYNEIFDKKEESLGNNIGFFEGLKASFDRTFFVEKRYKLILDGLYITILISLATAFFGVIFGLFICGMRRSSSKLLNVPAKVYIRAMQGTPMVVLLMILYYIVFASVDINAIIVAIIGFSMNFAAYTAEIMRTGVDSIDKGQIEAASAMGYRRGQVFKNIIFPQAARHCIPVLQGEFISTVKMTSVVGYIAIQDLTKASDIIRSRTYEAFFPLISTAIIYFLLAYIFTLILTYVEIKVDPKSRKRTVGVEND